MQTHSPQGVLWQYGGAFLPDSTSEWVETHREAIHRHVARVLTDGAIQIEARDPQTALVWLVKAADLGQTPEAFQRVITLSRRIGEAALTFAAEQALASLAAGEMATLSRLHSLN